MGRGGWLSLYPILPSPSFMPPVLSPPPGRLPQCRDKVFLQLVNVYLLACGPSQAGFLTKPTLQEATWVTGIEVTKLSLPNLVHV